MPKQLRMERGRLAGSQLEPTEQRKAIDHFMSGSLGTAKAYKTATKRPKVRLPKQIGERKLLRNALAPRFRPLSVLKRSIYRLACEIDDFGALPLLVAKVRSRGDLWDQEHRPRNATVIDWTLRLVRWRQPGKPSALGMNKPRELFDATTQTRLAVELNFAFKNRIEAEYVTMFIDELGGHELIGARIAAGEYDLANEWDWLEGLQRSEPYFDKLEMYKPGPDLKYWSSLKPNNEINNSSPSKGPQLSEVDFDWQQ